MVDGESAARIGKVTDRTAFCLGRACMAGREWIVRRGSKRSGFRYEREGGGAVRDRRTLARIEALRIPPGWREVRIAPGARSAIQAWGYDARGRKQYRYHERAVARGELRKYYRVRQLARELPAIRRRLDRDLGRREASREKIAAGVVRLIAEGFFRVGGERYARENRTFGITTLRKSHVGIDGERIVFSYVGKRAKDQWQVVCNARLADFVRAMRRAPGTRLFRYRDDGRWRDLTARDVNEYLHDTLGLPFTAKDFRTWGGTLRLATVLAEMGPPTSEREAVRNVALAIRLVAAELGNTPAICRKSYVHPMVIARYVDDAVTIERFGRPGASRSGGSGAHTAEEAALVRFLDEYFPERRRRARTSPRPARRDTIPA
jgi:DNA topoisomerase-1